jgi:uncharacterized protein
MQAPTAQFSRPERPSRAERRILIETLIVLGFTIIPSLLFPPLKSWLSLLPIVYLFVERQIRHRPWSMLGIQSSNFGAAVRRTWPLILGVLLVQPLFLLGAQRWLPELLTHIGERLPISTNTNVGALLGLLALGTLLEELSYRALFQERLSWFMPVAAAVIVVSVLFAAMHFAPGPAVLVAVDLGGVVLDSILYGFIFAQGRNLWVAWLAHFAADALALALMAVMLR